jgi:alpha-tubulin suppressor-like RCC1 family protein
MCAISNGELYSWGKGIDGQLGHGNTKNISKPTKVEGFDRNVE